VSLGGRISVEKQKNIKRSLNEIQFANLCLNRFQSVKTNERMFDGWDAYIIVDDIKVTVLWNGVWHFKK